MHPHDSPVLTICELIILTLVVLIQFAAQKHDLSLEDCKKNLIDQKKIPQGL
jgi:hypothetical protein